VSDDIEITAERPDSTLSVEGTDHVTLVGSNVEDTVAFYRDVLGMRLVMRQPNLDRSEVTHLFFDTGDGRMVTFFCEEGRDSVDDQDPEVGAVHHLAFRLDPERFREARERLTQAGHRFSEFDRGAFHSLYTKDHNGLIVELVADKFEIPDDRRAEILARAHALRVEAGAAFVRGEDLRAALDLPVEANDLPDAPAGTDVEREA
jgi:catechol 2,3-dioxygenase-like lactoylglutathione lyase family enzyme